MESKAERLLRWFSRNSVQLKVWAAESERHQRWLMRDPVAAIYAAGLTLDEDLISELEATRKEVFERLNWSRTSLGHADELRKQA